MTPKRTLLTTRLPRHCLIYVGRKGEERLKEDLAILTTPTGNPFGFILDVEDLVICSKLIRKFNAEVSLLLKE